MKKMKRVITGNVIFDAEHDYSEVEEIGGYLYCYGVDTKTSFPKLTTIGGHLYCHGADTKTSFPKLTTIGGHLNCRGADTKTSFPKLTAIGGHLDCFDADTKTSFPKLTTQNCGREKADKQIIIAFKKEGLVLFDGILSFIKETKDRIYGKVYKVVVVGQCEVSFCVEADGVFSHGDSIKQARESLMYKIGSRDKSAYEKWTLSEKITRREAIESYRVITGACESGTKSFVDSVGTLKNKYTVSEIIKLTIGQYGNESYASFFKGEK